MHGGEISFRVVLDLVVFPLDLHSFVCSLEDFGGGFDGWVGYDSDVVEEFDLVGETGLVLN